MKLMPGLMLIAVLACLVVLGILVVGVVSFARGGDARFRNRVMQMRIAAQAAALVLLLLVVAFAGR